MEKELFSHPDKKGIIRALPSELSEENRQRLKKFGIFMFLYDFAQNRFVRPRIHKADPQRHREILENSISSVKNSHVLDIGCGTGSAIPHFDSSNEYTGLDLSYSMLKQAVKKARRKSFQKFLFIQGNAEELLFDDESFEFVLMDTALHMIPKYQLAIAETARVLKKGGVFAVLLLLESAMTLILHGNIFQISTAFIHLLKRTLKRFVLVMVYSIVVTIQMVVFFIYTHKKRNDILEY
jgi:ubiquinone/menaquinone biosynthesis C-methylase UbiE